MWTLLRRSTTTTSIRCQWRCFTTCSPSQSAPLFEKILIANRGEIACRIMRTCSRLGIKTVAVYSDVDEHALHVRMADEAYCIGSAPAADSYMNVESIMGVIAKSGAQAVHPGYGFLSEQKLFCSALKRVGVRFIGPDEYALESMGDKIASKTIAKDAGVNIVPGYIGLVHNDDDVKRISREIGYPVMIKASAGGGGKGMRVAFDDEEAVTGFRLSTEEAKASFGDGRIFIEKFIEEPRHIEIQILCDSFGNAVFLNERECSIQRRNQKVIEEAPSVFLDDSTRAAMGKQALELAHAVQYQSAGTVEFLVDKHRKFYFLEFNTRLQVEHPVTELITKVDLVEQMIRVAAGEHLNIKQQDIGIHGWAIESRVYAEDPFRDFLPSIGTLQRYIEPTNKDIRCDSGIDEGSNISVFYDPMISKLITYGADRKTALELMRKALDSYVIRGVNHNISFLRHVCDNQRFIDGSISTSFIPEQYPHGFTGYVLNQQQHNTLVCCAVLIHLTRIQRSQCATMDQLSTYKPDIIDKLIVSVSNGNDDDDESRDIEVESVTSETSENCFVIDGHSFKVVSTWQIGEPTLTVCVNNVDNTLQLLNVNSDYDYSIQHCGGEFNVRVRTPQHDRLLSHMPSPTPIDHSKALLSPMPGVIFSLNVQVGDNVIANQEICVVEAMKMQNVLRCTKAGRVKTLHIAQGDTVSTDDVLVEFDE